MDEPKKRTLAPRRSYRLELDVQADTEEEMERALAAVAMEWARGWLRSQGASGGCGHGWMYKLTEADISAEQYQADLRAYLDERRASPESQK